MQNSHPDLPPQGSTGAESKGSEENPVTHPRFGCELKDPAASAWGQGCYEDYVG